MNPYGEIKVHLYTTMNGILEDIVVPLTTDCDTDKGGYDRWNQDAVNIYCPEFSQYHYLKNNHEAEESSFIRLALHECDSRYQLCKSRSEIDEFFRSTVISMYAMTVKPNLKNYEQSVPLYKKMKNYHYSVREETKLVKAHDLFILESSMEIDDDSFGLFDYPSETKFQEIQFSPFTIFKTST